MTKKITKAVIPAAGFGTRFLPQTKAMPKEMLPIVDKPVIQYVVEELVEAGIKDIIIVTGYHKRSIEDHFDRPSSELVQNLRDGGEKKKPLIEAVEQVSNLANFAYVRQKGPYGNGTPLLNIRHLIGNEPFIYTWSDDFIVAEPKSRFKQLLEVYDEFDCSVLGGIKADREDDYKRYGYAGGTLIRDGIIDVKNLVEKPGKQNAPSDLATVSGFVLTPDIFDYIDAAAAAVVPGGELYYNDALIAMIKDGKRVLAKRVENGRFCDTGNKLEYMKAVVEFGIKHEEIGPEFKQWLSGIAK